MYTIEYYSAIKKKEILRFVTTWMNFERIMLNEISDGERKYFIHMQNLKNETKGANKINLKETHRYKLVVTGSGGEDDWGVDEICEVIQFYGDR